MDQQIEEWIRFCEGREEFERHHFDTLFMVYGGRPKEELELICRYFPNCDRLVHNLLRVFDDELEPVDDLKSRLIELAGLDAEEKREIVIRANVPELAFLVSALQNPPVRFLEDVDAFDEIRDESEYDYVLHSVLSDFMVNSLPEDGSKSLALCSAFYFIANDSALERSLAVPLIEQDVSLERYLDIFCLGGAVALSDRGEIVVSAG